MSYSHPVTQQDLWVLEKITQPGTFVELGAFDGLRHSNTLLLEEKGWQGTLIEAYMPFSDQCAKNRPNAVVVNAVIGDGDDATLIIGGQYTGLLHTMPKDWLLEHHIRGNKHVIVETMPLADIIGTSHVDYLSLDTEGGEYEILRDWLKAGGTCTALTIEFRYDGVLLKRLEWLLSEHQMILDEVRGFDACFLAGSWYEQHRESV